MILGIDPGSRRLGVAIADPETRLARPLEVIEVAAVEPVARIRDLVASREVDLVVVGRPVGLSGRDGPAVEAQQALLDRLRAELDVEVREHDERFTTVLAERGMRAAGAHTSTRRAKRDAIAAQVMLQSFLDTTP